MDPSTSASSDSRSRITKEIPALVQKVQSAFLAQKTKPIAFRLEQLRKLWWGLQDNEAALVEACRKDLGKHAFETLAGEIRWCQQDIVFIRENLTKWTEDVEIPGTEPLKDFHPMVRKEPIGIVLIIGPYNFPIQLSVAPLVGAIAAGCTAVLKPSEETPYTSALLGKIITEYLDQSCYGCINGGIPETTALLEAKWDKIFFTGSHTVGRIIAAKAAQTLTPITLELGGRNPAFVTESADPKVAAQRLVFGKLLNAGQVCLSHNYTLVHRASATQYIESLKQALADMYPEGAKISEDFGRIVNLRNYKRIKTMLDKSTGTVLVGGETDEAQLFVEPTVVLVDKLDDPLIVEESFGPLMPIYLVDSTEEAITVANMVDSTPLSVSVFGNSEDINQVLSKVRSGGATINDTYLHASTPVMPLGGVGQSGMDSYRGQASFDCFTHRRSMATTPVSGRSPFSAMYPPYKEKYLQMRASEQPAAMGAHA